MLYAVCVGCNFDLRLLNFVFPHRIAPHGGAAFHQAETQTIGPTLDRIGGGPEPAPGGPNHALAPREADREQLPPG